MPQKIKLVVVNENALGFINPRFPDRVGLLHGSILKGYTGNGWESLPVKGNTVRLASEKDFDDYRCSFVGYNNDEYEYFKNF